MTRSSSPTICPWLIAFLIAALPCPLSQVTADEAAPTAPLNFADHAKRVFRTHCASCHNANKAKGDLDLTNYAAMMQGGGSGEVIEPGSADDSYLYQLITHEESPEMPPSGQKIPADDIKIIRRWINAGAIARSGASARKRKSRSFEMTPLATTRPNDVAMPVDWPTGSQASTIRPPAPASLASSPWAPLIAVAAANQVVLYHAEKVKADRLLGIVPWEGGRPKVVRFSRDGSRLLVAGGRAAVSGNIRLWNVATGEQELKLGDELDWVLAADLSPNGQRIATGGPERVVRIYAVNSDQAPTTLDEHTDWVTAIEFSPDGKYLASGDRNGGLILRLAATGEPLFRLPSHKAAVTSLAWRSDSRVLASASESGKVTFWNSKDGKPIKSFDANRGGCLAITFTRDGKLISGGRDKKAALWDVKGKRLQTYAGARDIITTVCVNDETETVFAGSFNGQLRSWNLRNGKAIEQLKTNPTAKGN